MYKDLPAHKLHTKVIVSGQDVHLDTLLASAWDHVPEVFSDLGVSPALMQANLDRYVRGLINNSMEHNATLLAAFLKECDLR
jgi:hypothetical protein